MRTEKIRLAFPLTIDGEMSDVLIVRYRGTLNTEAWSDQETFDVEIDNIWCEGVDIWSVLASDQFKPVYDKIVEAAKEDCERWFTCMYEQEAIYEEESKRSLIPE